MFTTQYNITNIHCPRMHPCPGAGRIRTHEKEPEEAEGEEAEAEVGQVVHGKVGQVGHPNYP